jgi:uncharacterized protein with NRDE domain
MCLIAFCYRRHPGYRLILAANRDEFLDRPTLPLGYNFPGEVLLAGKDLRGGGTWLGLAADGRLAAVTNYRDPARHLRSARSRGEIILEYLRSGLTAAAFLREFAVGAREYNGFNLLLADHRTLIHYSNISGAATVIEPGLHALSNHLLDTPWPKVVRSSELLRQALAGHDAPDRERIFALLADRKRPEDSQLPDTGVGAEWERLLSPIFIHSPGYGTRSSSLVTISDEGLVAFHERTYSHENGVHQAGEQGFRFILTREE